MSEEETKLDEEVEKKPKRRGRKKEVEEEQPITGLINGAEFSNAINEIQTDNMVSGEQVAELLDEAMAQAYLDWSYPGLFNKDSTDPAKDLVKAKVVFAPDYSSFKIYDLKTVMNDDDITDDSYQVSLEDAREVNPDAKLGDVVELPFDTKLLNKAYVRRVKQLFQAKLKDASRNAVLSLYSNRIGGLIQGTVTHADIENSSYELSFGKAVGYLKSRSLIPNDRFNVGDRVWVYLSDVSDRMNPPSLVISRSSDNFLLALLKQNIPEIQNGMVKVRGIAREAGRRTKVFVESTVPNIDAVGACIGPESSRTRAVMAELRGEKLDILPYFRNKAKQVIEAMKPATLIGLACPEDFFDPNVHYEEIEHDRDYEYPVVTAVVANGQQGIAIGTAGANVRLASKLTLTKINVEQADEAIKEGTKYLLLSEVEALVKKQEEALQASGEEEKPQEEAETATVPEEAAKPEEGVKTEEAAPAVEEKPAEAAAAPVEAPAPEEKAPVAEEKPEEKKPEEAAAPVEAPAPAPKPKEEKPVEHVEIYNKPKISLADLEEAISAKKGPSQTRSQKRRWEHKDAEENASENSAPTKASQAEAMPIYTEEELRQMQQDEAMNAGNENGDYYDDEDAELDEQYDDAYGNGEKK